MSRDVRRKAGISFAEWRFCASRLAVIPGMKQKLPWQRDGGDDESSIETTRRSVLGIAGIGLDPQGSERRAPCFAGVER